MDYNYDAAIWTDRGCYEFHRRALFYIFNFIDNFDGIVFSCHIERIGDYHDVD